MLKNLQCIRSRWSYIKEIEVNLTISLEGDKGHIQMAGQRRVSTSSIKSNFLELVLKI